MELSGFWSVETVEAFDRARRAAEIAAGLRSGDHLCLVDVRRHAVQSQAVAARAQAVSQENPIQPRKIALLVASAIARAQVSRIVVHPVTRVFDREGDAETWLFGPG
jgi:hypothetical protein